MPLTRSTAPLSLVLLHHLYRDRPLSSLVDAFAAATKRIRAGTLCPEDAHHLLDELLHQATPVPEHSLNNFLAALACAPASDACRDGPALAIALFDRVYREEAAGPQAAPFTEHTYGILIECCRRAIRPDLALAFFGRFLKTGLNNSDNLVPNTLRRCLPLSSTSPPSEFWSHPQKKKKKEFWSPIAAFSVATERVQAGMLSPEDAHHMFDKLLRQANPVPQRILDAFLAALSHAPSSDACRDGPALAVALFNRVYREKGLQVAPLSVYTYSIVMDCCHHSRRPDLGLAIFGRLLRMGLKTVPIIANNVLNFLCYTKSTDEAVNVLLHRMSELGCAPNYLSYSIVVKGLCDNGRSQQALDLLQLVVKEGVTCSLSVVQYNMVIKSFFKEGEVSKACNLFHRMPELGCAPNAFSYSIVAKGLCDDGRSQQALDLLQMAVKEGGTCSLSVVIYNTVINGFFKEGEVSKACHLFHEMKKQGFMPDVVTYTSVIDASCKARAMDKAELFLRQMIDNGVQPDVVTYNSMIHGYSTLGQWKEASKMFREMKSQGLRPDIITWRSLITPLHKHGRHHEAAGVFDSMTAKCHAPQT